MHNNELASLINYYHERYKNNTATDLKSLLQRTTASPPSLPPGHDAHSARERLRYLARATAIRALLIAAERVTVEV